MRGIIGILVSAIFGLWLVCGASAGGAGSRSERRRGVVVADSTSGAALSYASVYDRYGHPLGMCNRRGVLPAIAWESYPITLRYVGFKDRQVGELTGDTIFMQEDAAELPEVLVEAEGQRLLHILAYTREYSTLTSNSDTVFLFREKTVDFMIPAGGKVRFNGWTSPRVLASRSYYRFSDEKGLDSVSDESRHHFSWSDWVGISPAEAIPATLSGIECGSEAIRGRYGNIETWTKDGDRMRLEIDVLADTTSRKWVPNLSSFFNNGLDFESFRLTYDFDNVTGDCVSPLDLSSYCFNIESKGRGHGMFRFSRSNQPFYVSTQAEVYIMDKEYITAKEARKWRDSKIDLSEIGIFEPMEAPELSASVMELVERVDRLDKGNVRLGYRPDYRLVSIYDGRRNFKLGRRALFMLKGMTGISAISGRRKLNKRWDSFRENQIQHNQMRAIPKNE